MARLLVGSMLRWVGFWVAARGNCRLGRVGACRLARVGTGRGITGLLVGSGPLWRVEDPWHPLGWLGWVWEVAMWGLGVDGVAVLGFLGSWVARCLVGPRELSRVPPTLPRVSAETPDNQAASFVLPLSISQWKAVLQEGCCL